MIRNYIEDHYSEKDLSISMIADDLHYSPAYLCQVFKNETGGTINSFITEYRIKKAKEILRNGEEKLLFVANATGFNDPNYFTRQFKRFTGMTPSAYRAQYEIKKHKNKRLT